MRPHTRTQCNDGKECAECAQGGLSSTTAAASTSGINHDNSNEVEAVVTVATGNNKNVGSVQIDINNGPQGQHEKSINSSDDNHSSSESSNNHQLSQEHTNHQNHHYSRNSANTGEVEASGSFLRPSTSKILSSSFSSSPSSPFIVPTSGPLRRSERSMSHAAIQAAAEGSRDNQLDLLHSGSNPPARRGGLTTMPWVGGIRTIGYYSQLNRSILIVELPAEILVKILNYMSFNEISQVRLVSRRFNEICASMLNSTFHRLQSHMLSRFQAIKAQMPRRESARRNHPLARECDIVETLHMRLTLLQMTFGKHIERKHVCFFAGEILDEVQRILHYIKENACLGRAYKVTDELFDLSTMAMEYFKEHIEPTLPEITFFGAEFLDFTTPFSNSPTKRRSQSGNTSVFGGGLDSPCSSRASIAGSSCSEPWSTSSNGGIADDTNILFNSQGVGSVGSVGGFDVKDHHIQPQSNMVLRKRIRRIRQGMKRYNDQLVEVKRELKSCKTKMETQTKQVHEYSSRLEEYDKKFEENSRKFQTLLTELNKCKTELQYWRSKSTTLLSLPPTCAQCEAPLFPQNLSSLADAGLYGKSGAGPGYEAVVNELKALANQGVFPAVFPDDIYEDNIPQEEEEDDKSTEKKPRNEHDIEVQIKSACSRPSSPGSTTKTCLNSAPATTSGGVANVTGSSAAVVGRKRRSRDEIADDIPGESSGTRKSLRGAGVKSTRGKRPKVVVANN